MTLGLPFIVHWVLSDFVYMANMLRGRIGNSEISLWVLTPALLSIYPLQPPFRAVEMGWAAQ